MGHVDREMAGTAGEDRERPELQLVVLDGEQSGRRQLIDDGVTVGRAETTLMLSDEEVSRRHAQFRWTAAQGYVVEDLGSANGTLLNGERVQLAAVAIGDEIQIGAVRMQVEAYDLEIEAARHRQRLEALGSLGAGMAHDLNNTLCAAMGNVELLIDHHELKNARDPELREILDDIRGSLERTAELAPRFLHFARAARTAPARIDVSLICKEVGGLLARTLDRSIRITAQVEPQLEIVGSDTAVHQVVMNLCLNGRDAMAQGGGELQVLARRLKPSQLLGKPLLSRVPHVLVAVTDSGHGMSRATREQIFQPFFTTRASSGGSGLGLSTVMELVREHSGHIEVDSEPGRGTTVRVYLPAARSAPRTRRIPGELLRTVETPRASSRPLQILVVDDDRHVRRTLSRMLRYAGHDVSEAADGRLALQVVRDATVPFDVVLLDVDMPVKDGEQTQQELLEQNPALPVVVVTGHVSDDRMRRMAAAGAAAVLHKPVASAELLRVLSSLTNKTLSPPRERRNTMPLQFPTAVAEPPPSRRH